MNFDCVNASSGDTADQWNGNRPPRRKSPGLCMLFDVNDACSSQKEEEEEEEDKGENKEENSNTIEYENSCMSKDALMAALVSLTTPPSLL